MKFFLAEHIQRPLASSNDGKHFAGVDGLAFFGENALDDAALGRANFVLHLHGFDDEESLPRFHAVAGFHEQTHDFPRHGRDNLLAAFRFDVAVAATAPGARIDDSGAELVRTGLEFQFPIGSRGHPNFIGLTVQQDRESVGSKLDGVGVNGLTIKLNAPTASVAFKLDDARFPSRQIFELDFVFHGSGSNWARRPSSFQREGWPGSAEEEDRQEFLSPWFVCQIAAAMAAASEAALPLVSTHDGDAAEPGRPSSSSSHFV